MKTICVSPFLLADTPLKSRSPQLENEGTSSQMIFDFIEGQFDESKQYLLEMELILLCEPEHSKWTRKDLDKMWLRAWKIRISLHLSFFHHYGSHEALRVQKMIYKYRRKKKASK